MKSTPTQHFTQPLRTWSLFLFEYLFYFIAARSFLTKNGPKEMAKQFIPKKEQEERLTGDYICSKPSGIKAKITHLVEASPDCSTLVFESLKTDIQNDALTITLFYLHGGAFILPPSSLQYNFVTLLLQRLETSNRRVKIIFPFYPLALHRKIGFLPQDTINIIEKTLITACCSTSSSSAISSSGPIVILGDSAGGGLALALAQRLLKNKNNLLSQRLVSLCLFSPWCDVSLSLRSEMLIQEKTCCMLRIEGLEECGKLYCGKDFISTSTTTNTSTSQCDLQDPEASPLFGSCEGLPSTNLFVGTYELLLPEGRALRDKLLRANVKLRYCEGYGMPHVWPLLPLKDSEQAVDLLIHGIVEDLDRYREIRKK
jgi:epsilon-lactone hydrolase